MTPEEIAIIPGVPPLLQRIERYGNGLLGHSMRVCGHALALSRGMVAHRDVGIAALLHDVGKTVCDDPLYEKDGPLTDEERARLPEHVLRGMAMVEGFGSTVRRYVRAHHEYGRNRYRLDSPYAHCTPCAIVAVSDMFDGLVSQRVYKPALALDEVEHILMGEFLGPQELIRHILQRARAHPGSSGQDR